MTDILLSTINAKWIHPSLALRLLRANLGELEGRSAILEFALRQPLEEKVAGILAERPRILALSVSIWNHLGTLELLRALRQRWASGEGGGRPVVILGGPEAANLGAAAPLLAECDWLVRGEGEHAFRTLCRAVLADREPEAGGPILSVRAAGPYRIATAAPVDPETIDPGYRLYTDEDLRKKLTYVEASRGCPFGCEFCLSSLDRRVRHFPLAPFLAEMDALFGRGARAFKFLDRTFNLEAARARTIREFFLARLKGGGLGPGGLGSGRLQDGRLHGARHDPDRRDGSGAYVHFEMVPSRFPEDLREPLRAFPPGSLRLEVGIQTFDADVAAAIGRPSDPEKELEALDFLRDRTTAIVHADLIAGLPGETAEGFGRGFDRLWSVKPTEIQVGVLKRLPGAPLSRHDGPFRMRYAEVPPYEVISTSAMTEAELDRLKNFARFWELIVNRGHFPDLVPALLPSGGSTFARFMALSDGLLARFGRNWGIDRAELRAALAEWAGIGGGSAAAGGLQAKRPAR